MAQADSPDITAASAIDPAATLPNPPNSPAGESDAEPLPDTPHAAIAALARLREEAAREVERLLAFLDATDGNPDMEEDDPAGGDVLDEPHDGDLGALEWATEEIQRRSKDGRRLLFFKLREGDQTGWGSNTSDLEGGDGGDDPDLEPSLAFPGVFSGTGGSHDHGGDDDREDEHDGSEPDLEGEPSLGSFDRLTNQVHAWKQRSGECRFYTDAEQDNADREPCLGSPELSNVHVYTGYVQALPKGGSQHVKHACVSGCDQTRWASGGNDDREPDDDELEPDGTEEARHQPTRLG